jgi:hypothetical protein
VSFIAREGGANRLLGLQSAEALAVTNLQEAFAMKVLLLPTLFLCSALSIAAFAQDAPQRGVTEDSGRGRPADNHHGHN